MNTAYILNYGMSKLQPFSDNCLEPLLRLDS